MAQSGLSDVRSALVAYGSETGTAQDIAEEIGKLTRRLHFATRVTALSHISLVRIRPTPPSYAHI